MIEKIPKYASICSILILVGAVWHEYLYYYALGIDFFTYVTLTEVINLFLGSMPILILIGLVVAIYLAMLTQLFKKRIERLNNIKEQGYLEKKRILDKDFALSFLIMFICFLFYFGPLLLPINSITKKFVTGEIYFIVRVIVAFVFLAWISIPYLGSKLEMKRINRYLITFIAFFFCAIYYSASHKLWSVKNKPDYYFNPTTLVLKDSTIILTNDSLILVGKTNNYIFLYKFEGKAESSYSQIIPMDQIKAIYVTKYGTWYRLP